MRIVQINTFPYKATGNIMMNIHRLLTEMGYDSYVAWGRGRKPENDHEIFMDDDLGVKIHGVYTRLTDKTGFASKAATRKLIKRLQEINPDIIHLHNIHGYYLNIEILFNYIRNNKIKLVWTLHDCWAFTGHCAGFDIVGCNKWVTGCYKCEQKSAYPATKFLDSSCSNWKRKKELFTGLDAWIVTPSEWLKQQVEQSFLKDYPIKTIHNGIDIEVFRPADNEIKRKIRTKYGLDNRPLILGVASEWTEKKGIKDFAILSEKMPEAQFIIVGLTDKQIKKLPSSIKKLKRTSDIGELAAIYSTADIFFNPTYEDVFPTTNLEAMACGTPIITYDTGGSPEALRLVQNQFSEQIGVIVEKQDSFSVDYEIVKREIYKLIDTMNIEKEDKNNSDGYLKGVKMEKNCRNNALIFDRKARLSEYLSLYLSLKE